MSLRQTQSVEEYREMFELITELLRHAEEEVLLGAFMNGLKDEVRREVRLHHLGDLGEVMKLAKRVEEKNRVLGKGDGPNKRVRPNTNRAALNNRWNGGVGAGYGSGDPQKTNGS